MADIKDLTQKLIEFRDHRDWAQFHNPKDLALAINIEAGELLEALIISPCRTTRNKTTKKGSL
jgi:hypothetical protein